MSDASPVRVRADVERNRRRLLDAARAEFSEASEAAVPLDAVARRAGVGIATLYRHFPSREALIEAVYRDELGAVCDAAAPLLRRRTAARALRLWMGRYADFVATKRGMAAAVREVVSAGAVTSAQTRARLADAVATLLAAGGEDGTLRAGIAADDVVAAMAALVLGGGDRAQVDRTLDLLVAGVAARPVS